MISVVDKELIRRLYFKQEKSMRWIARELKMSRKTIRKALEDATEPRYVLTKPKPKPVTQSIHPIIQSWLDQEKSFPKKQRYTARLIYNRLTDEYNYKGSESSVRRIVAQIRQGEKETYIPLTFAPGSNAQCDWGSGYVYISGIYTEVQLFCMRLTSSRQTFVMAFPSQKQEAFFEGHVQAFQWLGGVPSTITYDNLKAAVAKVLQGRSRREQDRFISLRSHYLFESVFCTPGRGHEKGQIENLVGYVKRNFLTPMLNVSSFAELNKLLLYQCEKYAKSHKVPGAGLTILEAWEEEKKILLPLPARPFDSFTYLEVKASSSQLVRVDNCFYSVPAMWAGRSLTVKAYVYMVEIYGSRQLIAAHPRSYNKGEEIYTLDHYLDTLVKKPGALENARPYQNAKLPEIYGKYYEKLKLHHPRPEKVFVQILLLHRTVGWDVLTNTLKDAYKEGIHHLEGVRHRAEKLSGKHIAVTPLESGTHPHLEAYKVNKPRVDHFNQLIGRLGGVLH